MGGPPIVACTVLPTTVLRVPAPTGPTRSGQLWSGQITVWARPWPGDPGCAYLLITGGHADTARLPRRESVNEWLHTLELWGYRSVRTGAIGPEMAAGLEAAGFTTAQDLLLLSADLSSNTCSRPPGTGVSPRRHWPRLSRRDREVVLDIDRASFGEKWSLDANALAEAQRATVRSRIFLATSEGATVGFLLAGATGNDGYVQRLAVHPDHRRRGHAGVLLDHAHHWLRRQGCAVSWVNTEVSNRAAADLYLRRGYAPLPYGLWVLERRLADGSRA